MSHTIRPIAILFATLAATAAAIASPAASAQLVRMDVVDRDSGQTLPEYRHRAQEWIAGVPGHRYAVRLRNTTGERVLVVLSVDGVNAVSGQIAAPSQAGYVLDPWETTEIAGWRKSLDDIAQFVFTDLPDSYAARTGRPDNVGVIGIAVFRERQVRPVYAPPSPPIATQSGTARERAAGNAAKSAAPAAADSAMAESAPQRLGTGHGQREWAPAGRTEFRAASRSPQQVSQLRYDEARTLIANGILPRLAHPRHAAGPNAFPRDFVPDPPRDWR